jgi:hypothetical protein
VRKRKDIEVETDETSCKAINSLAREETAEDETLCTRKETMNEPTDTTERVDHTTRRAMTG